MQSCLWRFLITIINTKVYARAQLVAPTHQRVHTRTSASLLHSYIRLSVFGYNDSFAQLHIRQRQALSFCHFSFLTCNRLLFVHNRRVCWYIVQPCVCRKIFVTVQLCPNSNRIWVVVSLALSRKRVVTSFMGILLCCFTVFCLITETQESICGRQESDNSI